MAVPHDSNPDFQQFADLPVHARRLVAEMGGEVDRAKPLQRRPARIAAHPPLHAALRQTVHSRCGHPRGGSAATAASDRALCAVRTLRLGA